MFGNFIANYFCIFYWYYEVNPQKQMIYGEIDLILGCLGIPLNGLGTWYFLTFNYLCWMSLMSHWRAAWADPGVIPKGMVS